MDNHDDSRPPDDHDDAKNKYRRNYRACLNCRVRKVKCDLGPVDKPKDGKCARCLRERKDCVFVDSKRGGATNVVAGKRRRVKSDPEPELPPQLPPVNQMLVRNQQLLENPGYGAAPAPASAPAPPAPAPAPELSHFSTMEGALVFLARAAGTIAREDERDHIDAEKRHQQLDRRQSDTQVRTVSNGVTQTTLMTRDGNLDMLLNSQLPQRLPLIPEYIKPTKKRMLMPAAENGAAVRPRALNRLSSIDYIGDDGIISEDEAERLVNFFFSTMHPFFPHLPQFLELPNVLANYPILLCAILTIALRYHPFENNLGTTGDGGVPRNIEVHDRLWLYVQRLISQTVWAEASTRLLGTVFAFLLFTEWNPRAIHWRWLDYANRAEDPDAVPEPNGDGDNLAGLGAMRRLYRMAWMLIGLLVRLAQDMGFMEISPKTFLATHIAEINSVMNISRRSMLAHSLAEVELDEDDVSVEQMEQAEDVDEAILKMSEEELKRLSSEHVLRFTELQKAQIELLQIMSVGHEALYGYKAQLGLMSQRQNLMLLNIFSPLINNWGRKYKHFLVPSSNKMLRNVNNVAQVWGNPNLKIAREVRDQIEQELFIFEFNYLKLYIYSLALSPTPKLKPLKRKVNLKLDEISRLAKYIEQAFTAANEMLILAHRVHKLKMLRFMPVRWLTRLVRAVAFIVKCYLTITSHKKNQKPLDSYDIDSTILLLLLISIDDIIQSIQRAAITLRDCSPDELHLCTRYLNILMYLCSEMKTKKGGSSEEPTDMGQESLDFSVPYKAFDISQNVYERGPATTTTQSSLDANTPTGAGAIPDLEVMEWFMNDNNIGLDFVGPWTEMIEQQLNMNEPQFDFDGNLTG